MLSLSPFGLDEEESTFRSADQIDSALFSRYRGKNNFKVGLNERIVYEKVAGLKRSNINHSILYNFCSEGAFSDKNIPITLFLPDHDTAINAFQKAIQKTELPIS